MKLVSIIYFILILIAIYMSLYLMNSIDGFTTGQPIVNTRPPMANFGTNVWRSPFDNSLREFDKRYKLVGLEGEMEYPNHYTVTGEFIDDGPLEWNTEDL